MTEEHVQRLDAKALLDDDGGPGGVAYDGFRLALELISLGHLSNDVGFDLGGIAPGQPQQRLLVSVLGHLERIGQRLGPGALRLHCKALAAEHTMQLEELLCAYVDQRVPGEPR
jgi:hypothetical protein